MKDVRVAITGLRREGKTVFLTSLLNHLLEGSEETLPTFRDEAISFRTRQLPVEPGTDIFPYHLYLEGLRSAEPRWPDRTAEMTEFRLALTLRNLRTHREREYELTLVDYPGERLLDLPLLSHGFEEWSDETTREAEVGPRRELSESWREAVSRLPNGYAGDADEQLHAYVAYLGACRESGLTFLQPSALLLNGGDDAGPDGRFFPLARGDRERMPKLAHRFAGRYGSYVRGYVKPFFRAVGRCSRQVVLVDVMRILRQGVHSYNDTRRCLRNVLDAYGYAEAHHRFSPRRLLDLFTRRIERVVFVATKADQCTRATRGNLRYLLEELVEQKRRHLQATLPRGRLHFTFCAAHRSTEDVSKEFQGRELSCLLGERPDKEPGRLGPWFPGEIPMEWPEDAWNPDDRQFMFPDFLPRRIPMRDGAVIPHVNLDRVFWQVVEDLIP